MMDFNKAIDLVMKGKRVTRASWLCHHITKINKPGCKYDGKIVFGSVINGYKLYIPSDEDKNATDWVVYNR